MRYITNLLFAIIALVAASCSNGNAPADANGNFETDEVTVSTRAAGELVVFTAEEGSTVSEGDTIGIVDTTMLNLQRADLNANRLSIEAQRETINAQIKVREEELKKLQNDQRRIMAMYADKAATKKQVDDVNSAVDIAMEGLNVLRSQFSSIQAQLQAVQAKTAMLDQSIKDAVVVSPLTGTILTTYVNEHEMVVPGKPLLTIADLSWLNLRAYVSEDQLGEIKLGQEVLVYVDKADGAMEEKPGKVTWISSKAEFTPKTVQTREERVGQVYAVKIKVDNDGSIKIGMPGEVRWSK